MSYLDRIEVLLSEINEREQELKELFKDNMNSTFELEVKTEKL